jgi:hypothetical protein
MDLTARFEICLALPFSAQSPIHLVPCPTQALKKMVVTTGSTDDERQFSLYCVDRLEIPAVKSY